MRFRRRTSLSVALALLIAACSAGPAEETAPAKPRLGLFSTLPIYWGEGDVAALIDSGAEPDWVRVELESRYDLVPLDTLEPDALAGIDRVILAQPRALAPSENVSFDQWLTAGGEALIFADPMLTRHSEYPIGDRRRPQDVVLLSPLFDHWGLELTFDETQPGEERVLPVAGLPVPVRLHGRFVRNDSGAEERACTTHDEGLVARCAVGQGTALVLADAALLDWDGSAPVPERRKDALQALLGGFGARESLPRD